MEFISFYNKKLIVTESVTADIADIPGYHYAYRSNVVTRRDYDYDHEVHCHLFVSHDFLEELVEQGVETLDLELIGDRPKLKIG